jgi:hypothetical protein
MVMGCGGCSKQIYGILMLIALTITEVHSRDHVYYYTSGSEEATDDWNFRKISGNYTVSRLEESVGLLAPKEGRS